MSRDRATYGDLESVLGHAFADPSLLATALTHASAIGGSRLQPGGSFERLEFLGDRVLALVVAEMLLEQFPNENEGDIAKRHAAVVQRDALARVARTIDLGRHLRLSRSEDDTGGRENPAVLADALEAVIAALYRDGGLEPAAAFVRREFQKLIEAASQPPRDPKTALQEWAQGRGKPLPKYRTLTEEGPAHQPRFVVEVRVADFAPATGEGASKRAAERRAAAALLERVEHGEK
ncbi:MAG TPA: ribonuclease III [Alphaproteobacteria bacterium]|nr:ribonuclease III [Alphaproteobacteria bacterium]